MVADKAQLPDARSATMEALIGSILLGGVLASMALIVAGLAWSWSVSGTLGLDYQLGGTNLFASLAVDLAQIFVPESRGQALVSAGIAMLLLTPYLRVLASVFFFAFVQRNGKYTLFTGFVLAVLTYSLFLGA